MSDGPMNPPSAPPIKRTAVCSSFISAACQTQDMFPRSDSIMSGVFISVIFKKIHKFSSSYFMVNLNRFLRSEYSAPVATNKRKKGWRYL